MIRRQHDDTHATTTTPDLEKRGMSESTIVVATDAAIVIYRGA